MSMKKILSIILFVLGTLMFVGSMSLLKSDIPATIFGFVVSAACFIYPVMRIKERVAQKKAYGEKWKALPAVAVSVPLALGVLGLATANPEKEDLSSKNATQTTVVETEVTQEEPSIESAAIEVTPTPVPTDTPTPIPTVTPTPTPEPTESTTAAPTTKETTKETTKPTTKATTKAETKATEAPKETAAPANEAPKESKKTTKGPAAVADPPAPTESLKETSEEQDYILNTSKKKFHYPDCPSVKQMSEKNKQTRHCTREKLINEGYDACGNCHP